MFNLNEEELKLFKSLNTPRKIQDFIDTLTINFEKEGDTCFSPRKVLKENKCHCIEAAILAALILRVNGFPPLIVDLTASKDDFDHVIAVFEINGKWGAISKTNHANLRYREPIYDSIRELVMSYFHEYIDDKGRKTLRSYSEPVDLSMFDHEEWVTSEEDVWSIANYLVEVEHFPILNRKQIANLRSVDKIELRTNKIYYHKINLRVTKDTFPETKLKFTPKKTKILSNQKQLSNEAQVLSKFFKTITRKPYFKKTFIKPAPGRITSPFGTRRTYNGKRRSGHSGADIANIEGTPIKAANYGRVIVSDLFRYHGNTVMLDHGLGITTIYNHMQKIVVKKGQFIKRGEIIGYMGNTGLTTGHHLHWGMSIQNVRVDPFYWLNNEHLYEK